MSQPYVGEIRMFGGNFAPAGWMFCSGQLLPISEYETLFNLIGTTYGGDGQSTFGLPDLQGRVPRHQGNGFVLSQTGGVESVTVTSNQMPSHNHLVRTASAGAPTATPASATVLADEVFSGAPSPQPFAYVPFSGANQMALAPASIAATGGSQPHDNMQPFLAVSFIISLFGVFPSPT